MKSTARLFGTDTARWLRRFLIATVSLAAVAVILAIGPRHDPLALALGLAGAWAIGWHLHWQLRQLDIDDPPTCLRLFRSNRDAGLILVPFLAAAAAI